MGKMETGPQHTEPNMLGKEAGITQRLVLITIGASCAAIGLEMFLTPNQIIMGGIKGISGLLAHTLEIQMGLLLLLLNLPFILLYGKKKKISQSMLPLFGLTALSGLTILLHPFPPFIENSLHAALFGGLLIGFGVGLIIKYGGLSDGIQHVALFIRKRIPLSMGEIIVFMNIWILGLAGWMFGAAQAIYSLIAYVAAYQATAFTLRCLRKRLIRITSSRSKMIEESLGPVLGAAYRTLHGNNEIPNHEIVIVVSGNKAAKVRSLVARIDPMASFMSTPIAERNEITDYK
jgi:uncharacterized membrane-anchored protein YitT (DUF2179 family)